MAGVPKRTGFAAGLSARKADKVDNHAAALPLKIALREEALADVPQPHVLDLFAGKGAMWAAVWNRAETYLGCDHEWSQVLAHPGPVHHAAAQTVLRGIDLSRFNVFDLDAYGSPWVEVAVLAARRRLLPGEVVSLVLTDGAPRRAMLGLTAFALANMAGAEASAPGAHRRWTELVRAALAEAARRMGGELVALRQPADALGSRGMYYGRAVLRGLGPAQPAPRQQVARRRLSPSGAPAGRQPATVAG